MAPLSSYGHWLDREGEKQTYFYGANYGEMVCGCDQNNSCTYSPRQEKCNCDVATTRKWLSDGGHIDNKTALPITGFTYGFLSTGSKARVTIGALTCQGQQSDITEHNLSCSMLR
jgi:hypothetical protein